MATQTKRGRKPKPAALKRDRWIKIRVNELEETAAKARAQAAGAKDVSEYGRLQICGTAPEQTAARAAEVQRAAQAAEQAPGDKAAIEARLRREQPGLPSTAFPRLAARELARGR